MALTEEAERGANRPAVLDRPLPEGPSALPWEAPPRAGVDFEEAAVGARESHGSRRRGRARPGRRHLQGLAAVALLLLGGSAMTWLNPYGGSWFSHWIYPKVSARSVPTVRLEHGLVDILAGSGSQWEAGTGLVLSRSGLVVTNDHVVHGAKQIEVTLDGSGSLYPARLVGSIPSQDVALIQIVSPHGLAVPALGTDGDDQLTTGQNVLAMGNAYGSTDGVPYITSGFVASLGGTVTVALPEGRGNETLAGMIGVTAPVIPGDSGGLLVDSRGEVVGMLTATDQSLRLGFAIPISTVMSDVKLIESGRS